MSELSPLLVGIGQAASSSTRFVLHISRELTLVLWPSSSLAALAFILAPILVFTTVSWELFILTPLHTFLYVLDFLYPVYVLSGVACIVGLLIGYTAKVASEYASNALVPQKQDSQDDSSLKPPEYQRHAPTIST